MQIYMFPRFQFLCWALRFQYFSMSKLMFDAIYLKSFFCHWINIKTKVDWNTLQSMGRKRSKLRFYLLQDFFFVAKTSSIGLNLIKNEVCIKSNSFKSQWMNASCLHQFNFCPIFMQENIKNVKNVKNVKKVIKMTCE